MVFMPGSQPLTDCSGIVALAKTKTTAMSLETEMDSNVHVFEVALSELRLKQGRAEKVSD